MGRKTIAFIVNPNSGKQSRLNTTSRLEEYLKENKHCIIYKTEYAGHASEIARKLVEKKADTVVAVGGDGTINEIASELVNSNTKLGIVPMGSGNGLARHLNIPLRFDAALKLILEGKAKKIDAGKVNERWFFCTSGAGFDATIGKEFATMKGRGFINYVRAVFRHYFKYTSRKYTIKIDGNKFKEKAFLVTVANASQWGNNAFIAPEADVRDGLLDVCVLYSFPPGQSAFLAFKMFSRKLHETKYLKVIKGKNIEIKRKKKGPVHFDGEPAKMGKRLTYSVYPKALRVIANL